MKYQTKSEKETFNLAKKFSKQLRGGEVLLMVGDLGAGKTAFTKGLAAGLGIKNIITSPTFVLMKIYPVKSRQAVILAKAKLFNKINESSVINGLAHIDAYRLKEGSELMNIGATDYFNDSSYVTVIEWAERVKDIWPKKKIFVRFKILENNKREITIK